MIRTLIASSLLFLGAAAFAQEAPTTSTKPFVYAPKASDIVIGKANAPVVLVEYASLSCPHCADFYVNTLPTLQKKYIDTGKVQLIYRNYPLNKPAMQAAMLVQCVDKDRRHAFLKVLFNTQRNWAFDSGTDSLANIAALGGVDHTTFDTCMKNKAIENKIFAVTKEAQNDYKVNSTPAFFINGKTYEGDHDVKSMSGMIDKALTHKGEK